MARDASTGKQLWAVAVPGVPLPAFRVSDGLLLVTNGVGANGVLAAVDLANGHQLWDFDRATMPPSVMAAGPDAMVLQLYQSLYAVDPGTGRVMWTVGARTGSVATDPAGVVVYVQDLSATSTSVRLVERSAPTGKLAWQEALPNGSGLALVLQDDVVYVSAGAPQGYGPMPVAAYAALSGRRLWSVSVPGFFSTGLVLAGQGGLLIDASGPPYACAI